MRNLILLLIILGTLSSCKKKITPLASKKEKIIEFTARQSKGDIFIDSLLLKDKSQEIKEFYKTNDYKIGWGLKQNREDLISEILKLQEDGINPKKYAIYNLKNLDSAYDILSEDIKMHADILFSETFQKAAEDLYNGILNPKQIYNDWDIMPKNINVSDMLHLMLNNRSISTTFDSIRSNNPIYIGLKKALKTLNKLPEYSFEGKIKEKKIKLNDTLLEVIELKNRLRYWGDLDSLQSHNDRFDQITVNALKKFQKRNGIKETGYLDIKTSENLNLTKADLIARIIVNLERWRWFPRELGKSYVLVNIPDFNLVAVSKGDTVQKRRIIVGRLSRKTPILSSKFSGIIINPTWTVPPTILRNDLIPSASKNLNYFSSRDFTIYDYEKNIIIPEDWNPQHALRYRYVQKPGKSNALGRIKFNYSNKYMVYLHDTNNRNNFNRETRTLSSGCIRVENPFVLAKFVLTAEGRTYNKKEIDQWLKEEKTHHIPLNKNVQIHELYWTAWRDKEGIQFREDIYKLDSDLFEKIKAKSRTANDLDN